jgi:Arc/MetJ-type ribon-helix-helix transcriptional regulator
MGEMRKITVDVPEEDLAAAQRFTGSGVTETVRAALRQLRSIHAQHQIQKLRGKVTFSLSLDELREDRD